jgi:uncharacterized protein YbaP (TraB family)
MRSHRIQRIVLAILCALLAISGYAQTSPYKPGSPLLMWKISSRTNSAYLLGSVHLGDKSLYPLPSVMENAFTSASVLIVEVDITKVDQFQMAQLMATVGTYPEGDDLFKHLTPETRAKLNAFLGAYGMPPELFARMRPWILGTALQMLPMMKDGLNPNEGIDLYFLNKAGNKRVEQLEDAEWQIKLLADMPDKLADPWLQSAITQAEDSKNRWTKFATYWREGAADKIDELTTSTNMGNTAEEKAFERRLREDRNLHMTDRLEKCLSSSESCFMVVGAAHVVGREGIVKQLQARGYHVEQAVVEKNAPK